MQIKRALVFVLTMILISGTANSAGRKKAHPKSVIKKTNSEMNLQITNFAGERQCSLFFEKPILEPFLGKYDLINHPVSLMPSAPGVTHTQQKCDPSLKKGSSHWWNRFFKKENKKLIPVEKAVAEFSTDCIAQSQKSFRSPQNYCDSRGNSQKSPIPPCATPEYSNYVANSYREALRCVNNPSILPEQFFVQLRHEGGFHIASDQGGGSGPGQLTPSAIKHINTQVLNGNVQDQLRGNSPLCSDIKLNIAKLKMESKSAESCDRVKVPPNPLMNFLYSALLFQENIRQVQARFKILNDAMGGALESALADKSEKDRAQIIAMVAQLAYNSGSHDAIAIFAKFLKDNSEKKSPNLTKFKKQFILYVYNNFSLSRGAKKQFRSKKSQSKREDVLSKYLYKMYLELEGKTLNKQDKEVDFAQEYPENCSPKLGLAGFAK